MEGYHKKSNIMNIDTKLLSKLFNTNKNEINKFCNKLYKNKIRYYELPREERDSIIIKILNKIKNDSQIIASKGRKKNGMMAGKKIKILKTLKSPFGSLMLEGYNLIVWKCIK